MLLINTFDIEPWWATVPPCVAAARWDDMPDRSEHPLHTYLDLCDEAGVKCTFFCVGWYGRRFPERVREVVARGHELGCHSLFHEDAAQLSLDEFRVSTRAAKSMLEDATGARVIAYRAPSFSFPVDRCAELFRVLVDLGFEIDSSVSTAQRLHGGGFSRAQFHAPGSLREAFGVDLFEVPVPGVSFGGRDLQVFGGGYLRLTPKFLLDRFAAREPYQVLYLHPHDFDVAVPDLPQASTMSNWRRRMRLGDLREKVRGLFAHAEVRSCGQLMASAKVVHG